MMLCSVFKEEDTRIFEQILKSIYDYNIDECTLIANWDAQTHPKCRRAALLKIR